ncbi:MAG: endonuclease/exonuclease/phosphatase family protein [Solirubrobacterales bacterium]
MLELRAPTLRTVLAWLVVAPWAAWGLVRIFGLEQGFPLVPLMAYTPYVLVISALGAGVVALLRRWAPTAVGAAATVILVIAVLPRLIPDGDPEIEHPVRLRVMTVNSHKSEADPDALARLVRENRIDLLSVQELTTEGAARLRRSAVARRLPHGLLALQGDAYGSGIFSRYPLRKAAPVATIREIDATVRLPGARVEVSCVHPVAPTASGSVGLWRNTLDALPRAEPGGPLRILAGDFNATLDHDALRDLIASGYRDAADAEGAGLDFTWPVGRPFPPLIAIDHVLADERIGVSDFEVHDVPGSDHRAITVALSLPRAGSGSRPRRPKG